MNEIWRDIDGYGGDYQVSNLGRVRSFKHKTPRILELKYRRGYFRVQLSRNNKSKTHLVHRLVAQAFVPNPLNKPEVNHLDGDKLNNRAENLEWCTSSENRLHAFATGLQRQGEERTQAKFTNEQVRYVRDNPDGLTQYQLAEKFGVGQATISYVQTGKAYKNAGGTIREPRKFTPRLPDDVREQIRREHKPGVYGCGYRALAKKYGVAPTTILSIVKEKSR